MSGGLVEDLRAEIGRKQAVLVIGTGVTAAVSGGDRRASWVGLLESALHWCQEFVPGLTEQWSKGVQAVLEIGDSSSLITAAEMLTEKLGGRGGGDYRRWLRETVGELRLVDRSLPEAVAALGVPLATTNYDGLLEQATGWRTVTWRDGARIQRVLRGDERAVVHLHGYWEEPESVVLGIRSYEQVLGDAAAQALERAMASMRSLVFVGVGEGANDPNFAALRQWLSRTFPGTEYRHFRLCLESEVAALVAQHSAQERILPVAYGAEYAALAGFLRGLAVTPPTPSVLSPAPPSAALPGRRSTLGRDDQVAEVVSNLLTEPPAPTLLLGPPGIGKTNLTLAALHHPQVAGNDPLNWAHPDTPKWTHSRGSMMAGQG
jgi:SIR2-like protein